jgi:predicted dehydrogenase
MNTNAPQTRRAFLRGAGTTVAAFTLVPRHVLAGSGATPPSDKPNLAAIGIGGMGNADLDALTPHTNVVAVCDVDLKQGADGFKKHPKTKPYRDFRRMLDEQEKSIDCVLVATPDHFHAVAAMGAIQRGKHVYCEKPLAHSVYEVRQLMKAAQKHKVVTQLGNQGHSFDSIRTFVEWIHDGAIGNVHTIHCRAAAVNSGVDDLPHLGEHPEVPATLDWDTWLGPAKERPYNPIYLPAKWRGWVPFGNGTVGDWVCHVVDPVFWALDLGAPTSIQAKVKDYDFKKQPDAFPKGDVITYEFPAKGARGPITLYWYSGTERMPRPADFEPDDKDIEYGAAVIGDKGTIVYGSHGAGQVHIVPQAKMDAYKNPPQTIPRAKEHHLDWIEAIRNGTKAGSDFSYGGPLTEIAMLGVIAIKMNGTKLEWDTHKMKFPNCPEADRFINLGFRTGWRL